jgi:cell fate (sporulation/competence/biofilm development) regulator YlbF (YheA/YmcA/DUF963 family)
MQVTEEIKDAARQLGQALWQDDYIRLYLDVLQATQADPDASALEKKMYEAYEGLIGRQQTGEESSEEDIQTFRKLRSQVQQHPLVSQRTDMLNTIRPYLRQIAEEISSVLGVDFAALARTQ